MYLSFLYVQYCVRMSVREFDLIFFSLSFLFIFVIVVVVVLDRDPFKLNELKL